MTANDSPEDCDACLRAGMDDYLVKPIQAAIVIAAVQRWTDAGRHRPPPREPARLAAGRHAVSDADRAPRARARRGPP